MLVVEWRRVIAGIFGEVWGWICWGLKAEEGSEGRRKMLNFCRGGGREFCWLSRSLWFSLDWQKVDEEG